MEQNRLEENERGEAYNLVDGTKIKLFCLAAESAGLLSCGQAAHVRLGKGYELVPGKVAR